jgi:hypothetical protein
MFRVTVRAFVNCRNRRLRSLTGQCALIFGEAIEFVVDVKEALQETAKFTLALIRYLIQS